MGNFQLLADQVLRRSLHEVSSLLALREETGNFKPIVGNFEGNSKNTASYKTLIAQDFSEETVEETTRKPGLKRQETFALKKSSLQFPKSMGTIGMLEDFFKQAEALELKLLHDDKRWLKEVCISEPLHVLEDRLNGYVECWVEAMQREPKDHRKQNAGRFKANVFLRESMSVKSKLVK